MRRKCWSALLPLLLLGMACQEAQEPAEPAPAVAISTEADGEALRALIRQFDADFKAGNLDGVIALYADDAVQMPPNSPIVIGKDSLRSEYEGFLEANTVELRDRFRTCFRVILGKGKRGQNSSHCLDLVKT